ncbi:phosphatidylinositol-specific phospholipase C1-like protein [Aestuariivivens sp. NBU2969]|uniref:phosphatidylinositol-specific phospholipase C1-like protein n=1 Tax=Aestuariivivens sp. NBU2969 TaxID=2873267 RepID=UPI001CBDB6B6|nr:phosphatidylinositol-specific phospholipase C1-like protein [Aestuariivivens sp. NBU2969]
MKLKHLIALIAIHFIISCNTIEPTAKLKLNNIQVIGSHNSYKKSIEPALLEIAKQTATKSVEALQYSHVSLTEQLNNYGLRNLEIDVVVDTEGGKFANPFGIELLKQNEIEAQPYDTLGLLNTKGFKVIHIPDLDFRTTCYRLVDCLNEIKAWSDAHPRHLPIAITFNAKTENLEIEGFQELLPFTAKVFNDLEREILSELPRSKLITPDDVRGDFYTLEEAIKANNWPELEDARGKIILVLDEEGEKRDVYINGHPSLKGRLFFTNSKPGTPEAAFLIVNDPIRYQDSIKALVRAGYLVRTRADADTREARTGDYTRFKAALNSGAHYISTDYYQEDKSLNTNYEIEMPNGVVGRCNPVLPVKTFLNVDLESK